MLASILQFSGLSLLTLVLAGIGLVAALAAFFAVLVQRYSARIALQAGMAMVLLFILVVTVTGYSYRQTLATRYRAAEDQTKKAELVQNVREMQNRTANSDVSFSNGGVEEGAFFDTESISRQELLKKLNFVEKVLGTALAEDEDDLQTVKNAFDEGRLGDYEEMVRIAQLEIRKREHIIKAMDKKLEYVKGASFLKPEEQKEQAQIFEERKYQAAREKQDYERILSEVQNHSELYKKLGN